MARRKSPPVEKSSDLMDGIPFRLIFEGHSAAMLLIDPATGRILDANQAALDFYGYSKPALCGMSVSDIHVAGSEQAPEERRKPLNMEKGYSTFSHRLASGEERIVEVHSSPIVLGEKKILFSIIHDITGRRQVYEELRQSEERYRTLFDNIMDGIYRSTHAGRFVDVNPAMVRMFGYSNRGEMLAVDIKNELYFSPEERGSHILDTGREEIEVYRMRRKDGSEIWVEDHGYYVHDERGNILYHEGMLRDVTARKESEAELHQAKDALEAAHRELEKAFERERQLARVDTLTGLNNRRHLFELAAHEFNMSLRYDSPLSVLMFDVDDFKLINDNYGHAVGDQTLQHLAQVVRAQLRTVDVLGRYGGDEFIILLPQTTAGEAQVLGERLHASVAAAQMETGKGMFSLTISLGIAQTIHHAAQPDSMEDLLLRADQALYAAKQGGRNLTAIFGAK